MLNEQTIQKLNELKLHALAQGFREYLDTPGPDSLSFDERFGLLVDRQWTARQENRLRRALAQARLREQACLEDVDYRHQRGLDRSVMQRLAAGRWLVEHQNVLLSGPTGVGKTWLACALAHQACRDGHSAVYHRLPRLLQTLAIARADGSYTKELARLARTRLLVLDDFGLAVLTDEQRRDLLELLDDRHGRASTIVTSQLPVKQWHAALGDPTIADAVLDRLLHHAHRLELKGPSLRNREPENK